MTEAELRKLAEEGRACELILGGQLRRSEQRLEALSSDPSSSLAEIAAALREVNELRPDLDELEALLGDLQARAREFRGVGWSDRELDAIAVGIGDDALVVAVAGAPGSVEDRVAVGAEQVGQLVDGLLGAECEGDVDQAKPLLIAGSSLADGRHLHQLEPCAVAQVEEVGTARRLVLAAARDAAVVERPQASRSSVQIATCSITGRS